MLAPLTVSLALALALALAAPDAAPPTVRSFRTEAAPRVDPVFPDVASLRVGIDQFLALQGEMEKVRDEFSTALHDTLARLGPVGAAPPRTCPGEIPPSYARASEAGRRYLGLGRRLEARFREIRRADELGDAVGLTPDYRIKTRKARELYLGLLRDYREMRVAFYDQLGAEMRHAGCKLPPAAPPAAIVGRRPDGGAPRELPGPDPADPGEWVLEPPEAEAAALAGKGPAVARAGKGASDPVAAIGAGPAIWIEIDNTRCARPSTLTVDRVAIGDIAAQKQISVRTRAGPHELCVLPTSDKRTCGAPGTVRRAYLYEGWTLAVRCEK
jgi:hypothetical protein